MFSRLIYAQNYRSLTLVVSLLTLKQSEKVEGTTPFDDSLAQCAEAPETNLCLISLPNARHTLTIYRKGVTSIDKRGVGVMAIIRIMGSGETEVKLIGGRGVSDTRFGSANHLHGFNWVAFEVTDRTKGSMVVMNLKIINFIDFKLLLQRNYSGRSSKSCLHESTP